MQTEKEYRAASGVNWSNLKHMKSSPLDYLEATKKVSEPSEAQKLGSFIDCALLTPEETESRYLVVPELKWSNSHDVKKATVKSFEHILEAGGMDLEAISGAYKMRKEDFSNMIDRCVAKMGKIPIPESEEGKSLFNYKKAKNIIEANLEKDLWKSIRANLDLVQAPLFAKCEHTGLELKGLADMFTSTAIIDLKTIGTMGSMYTQIRSYGYLGQLAFYDYLAKLNGLERKKHGILFVETTRPYKMRYVNVPKKYIQEEHKKNVELLTKVKECLRTGIYSDGSDEIIHYQDKFYS